MVSPNEQSGPQSHFEVVRSQVQANLLANDAVFRLVSERLTVQDTSAETMSKIAELVEPKEVLLPDFKLDLYYARPDEDDERILEGDSCSYTGLSFLLTTSGKHSTQEGSVVDNIVLAEYQLIRLGHFTSARGDLSLYDNQGQLHVLRPSDRGYIDKEGLPVDHSRFSAVGAWLRAHNALVEASLDMPGMHLSPTDFIWVDQEDTRDFSAEE
jgi:hypothetical protein